MLQKLIIHNFRVLRHLEVVFAPRVMVLVGPTDQGKSTTLHALRWLCTNQPSGDDFISWGEEECWVELWVDGHVIRRTRGKGVNSYTLDGEIFVALGQGTVPQAIQQILSVHPFTFQQQHDAPFLFSLSPSQVAKELNQVVNLSVIDAALENITAKVRKGKARVELTQERFDQAHEELQNLAWVHDWIAQVEALQQQEGKLTTLQAQIAVLRPLLKQAIQQQSLLTTATQANQQRTKAIQLGQQAQQIQNKRWKLQQLLQHVSELSIERVIYPSLQTLLALAKKHKPLNKRLKALQSLLQEIHQWQKKSVTQRARADKLLLQLKKQTPNQCPFCQQPIRS